MEEVLGYGETLCNGVFRISGHGSGGKHNCAGGHYIA